MKAIHGGKAKNDKIDSHKIAVLLRGGMLPHAYVYPAAMRSTRDLLRRRLHLVRKRGELLAHIQNTRAQYNLPAFEKHLAYAGNREGVAEHFPDPSVRKSIEVDMVLGSKCPYSEPASVSLPPSLFISTPIERLFLRKNSAVFVETPSFAQPALSNVSLKNAAISGADPATA